MNDSHDHQSQSDAVTFESEAALDDDRRVCIKTEAVRFLSLLDPDATFFTFQTFDDNRERKEPKFVRILHGSLDECWTELARLNERGAGVFVTVNETDGKGRRKENIVRVRAVFEDLDGAPLDTVMQDDCRPHMVVETSPGRYHTYRRVVDFPLDDFTSTQKAQIERFKSDPSVHDLPRVMRLPGFFHRKGEPSLVRVVSTSDHPPYRFADFPRAPERGRERESTGPQNASRKLNNDALANLTSWVPKLFPEAIPARGGYRVTSEILGRSLEEDLSIMPQGIKDFGVHDLDDPQEGRRTPIDIVQEWGEKDFDAAVHWLRRALGQLPDDGMTEEQSAEVARLAALSPFQYDQERGSAAHHLGIRVTVLDKLVEHARPVHHDAVTGQGALLNLVDLEPWPDPVEGKELVADMEAALRRYVVLNEPQMLAVALWAVHSHAIGFAEHSPRLHLSSPAMRCGKSTLKSVVGAMASKGLETEDISIAALFRVIEMAHPTLLIDEADIFLADNEDARKILNAGHRQGGQVIRTVGEDFEPRAFSVYGAVVIAGIGEISSTLEDRSITIDLRRRLPDENIARFRSNRIDHLLGLGRRAARWVSDNQSKLIDADPPLPESLGDRECDNWRPLIAIADAISEPLGKRARDAALLLADRGGKDDEGKAVMALADVAAMFELKHVDRISSIDLVNELVKMDDRPWGEWRRGQPMNQLSLSKLLKPFGIRPKMIRFNPKPANSLRGYERAPIAEAKNRYVETESDRTEEDIDLNKKGM